MKIARFKNALKHLHSTFSSYSNVPVILLGDFNINLNKNASHKNTLFKYLIEEKNRALVAQWSERSPFTSKAVSSILRENFLMLLKPSAPLM